MSAHTKMHPTNGKKNKSAKQTIPWREAFKRELREYGEGGLALRGARRREGLTQVELAIKTGMAQHHISEIENNKRSVGKEVAKRLAKVLHTDYRVFL